MKKFRSDSLYPYIILGLVAGGIHYLLKSMLSLNPTFAFFGSLIAALIIYSLIVERKQ